VASGRVVLFLHDTATRWCTVYEAAVLAHTSLTLVGTGAQLEQALRRGPYEARIGARITRLPALVDRALKAAEEAGRK
jgi:hypothetical protein